MRLGSWVQALYEVFNPPAIPEPSPDGRGLVAQVHALGGEAHWMGRTPRVLGLFGGTDQFHIRLNRTDFIDADLVDLATKHADRIWGLDIRNTRITNFALGQLRRMPNLQQLVLGNDDERGSGRMHGHSSPITDAGLEHLQHLRRLMHLDLSGLPITDAGLAAIRDLPSLGALYLMRTKVEGSGLGQLKSLPALAALYLDGSEVSEEHLSQLAALPRLQVLSLNRVPLTAKGLKPLKALARLRHLFIAGCGLLDLDLDELRNDKPQLKIQHR
jgi:hypothetical protein